MIFAIFAVNKTSDMKEKQAKYAGYFIAENVVDYFGQLCIVKLSFPRLFLRFKYDEAGYFSSFENWKENIVILNWLDPQDKPKYDSEIDEILLEAWNFLCETEEKEENMYELLGGMG